MTRKLIVLTAVFLFALPHARADEASKRAKIEELFTVQKVDSLIQQMAEQSYARNKELLKNMMGGRQTTEIDRKIVDQYATRMNAEVSEQLNWVKLKPAYIDLYASTFSEEEIDGILAFYKSPIGQSMLAKNPELIAKSGEIVNSHMKALGPQMQKLLADMRKQIHAAHSN